MVNIEWSTIKSGVRQESILGSLLVLIHIKDLSEGLITNTKHFSDDVSLFSVVDNISLPATYLDSKINSRPNQWKMTFNPDSKKQVQKVIFS